MSGSYTETSAQPSVPVRTADPIYTFSDSYFKAMRKQDLINYIRTIEKNWENQLITNDIQYNNCKKLLAEERNKAIDEFAERLKDSLVHNYRHLLKTDTDGFEWLTTDAVHTHIDKIAEQLKEGAE